MRQANTMTLIKPIEDGVAVDENLAVAEDLFKEAGVILGNMLSKLRQDEDMALPAVRTAINELSTGWKTVVQERNRVADERKKEAGVVGSYAIDFDAARAEVGRRLACLREAGDG